MCCCCSAFYSHKNVNCLGGEEFLSCLQKNTIILQFSFFGISKNLSKPYGLLWVLWGNFVQTVSKTNLNFSCHKIKKSEKISQFLKKINKIAIFFQIVYLLIRKVKLASDPLVLKWSKKMSKQGRGILLSQLPSHNIPQILWSFHLPSTPLNAAMSGSQLPRLQNKLQQRLVAHCQHILGHPGAGIWARLLMKASVLMTTFNITFLKLEAWSWSSFLP